MDYTILSELDENICKGCDRPFIEGEQKKPFRKGHNDNTILAYLHTNEECLLKLFHKLSQEHLNKRKPNT